MKPASGYKVCSICGEQKRHNSFHRRHDGKGYLPNCILCEQKKEKNTCLWCGDVLKQANSTYCKNVKGTKNCRYEALSRLAKSFEIEPDEIRKCTICGNEYGYYKVLGNTTTCTSTTGSDCAKILCYNRRKEGGDEYIPEIKRRPKLCLTRPLCEKYCECLGNGFKEHNGKCYVSGAIEKINIHTGLIHSYTHI